MTKETTIQTLISSNTQVLSQELSWFEMILDTRLKLHFGHETDYESVWNIPPPSVEDEVTNSTYANLIAHYKMHASERMLLILSLITHIRPELLDIFWTKNTTHDRGFTEFGGAKGNNHGGFLPTGETALFLLAGNDLDTRLDFSYLFENQHFFFQHQILKLEKVADFEPTLSGVLSVAKEFVGYLTTGISSKPQFSREFPAKLIETEMTWDDLVLPQQTLDRVIEIKDWIEYGAALLGDWGMSKKIKPGYKSLFHGPSGTGKTLTACLLGKYCGLDVYRIDLSMVVSKYIGETEKNLSGIFDQAENKNWILFFDEADALFGKRTNVSDAHDKYANQEVSYLLQRLEEFNGVVILASNMKSNMDDAFTRRFQSIISFPIPPVSERLKLWSKAFSDKVTLEQTIDLQAVASKYELTGGTIMNVVRYASIKSLKRGDSMITKNDLEEGIKREYGKEGRSI